MEEPAVAAEAMVALQKQQHASASPSPLTGHDDRACLGDAPELHAPPTRSDSCASVASSTAAVVAPALAPATTRPRPAAPRATHAHKSPSCPALAQQSQPRGGAAGAASGVAATCNSASDEEQAAGADNSCSDDGDDDHAPGDRGGVISAAHAPQGADHHHLLSASWGQALRQPRSGSSGSSASSITLKLPSTGAPLRCATALPYEGLQSYLPVTVSPMPQPSLQHAPTWAPSTSAQTSANAAANSALGTSPQPSTLQLGLPPGASSGSALSNAMLMYGAGGIPVPGLTGHHNARASPHRRSAPSPSASAAHGPLLMHLANSSCNTTGTMHSATHLASPSPTALAAAATASSRRGESGCSLSDPLPDIDMVLTSVATAQPLPPNSAQRRATPTTAASVAAHSPFSLLPHGNGGSSSAPASGLTLGMTFAAPAAQSLPPGTCPATCTAAAGGAAAALCCPSPPHSASRLPVPWEDMCRAWSDPSCELLHDLPEDVVRDIRQRDEEARARRQRSWASLAAAALQGAAQAVWRRGDSGEFGAAPAHGGPGSCASSVNSAPASCYAAPAWTSPSPPSYSCSTHQQQQQGAAPVAGPGSCGVGAVGGAQEQQQGQQQGQRSLRALSTTPASLLSCNALLTSGPSSSAVSTPGTATAAALQAQLQHLATTATAAASAPAATAPGASALGLGAGGANGAAGAAGALAQPPSSPSSRSTAAATAAYSTPRTLLGMLPVLPGALAGALAGAAWGLVAAAGVAGSSTGGVNDGAAAATRGQRTQQPAGYWYSVVPPQRAPKDGDGGGGGGLYGGTTWLWRSIASYAGGSSLGASQRPPAGISPVPEEEPLPRPALALGVGGAAIIEPEAQAGTGAGAAAATGPGEDEQEDEEEEEEGEAEELQEGGGDADLAFSMWTGVGVCSPARRSCPITPAASSPGGPSPMRGASGGGAARAARVLVAVAAREGGRPSLEERMRRSRSAPMHSQLTLAARRGGGGGEEEEEEEDGYDAEYDEEGRRGGEGARGRATVAGGVGEGAVWRRRGGARGGGRRLPDEVMQQPSMIAAVACL